MQSESTRATLLSRVRDTADHESWREFDARYRELMLRFCRRCGLQAADAEDVRQSVMISLARSLRGFEYRPERGRFRDYLGRVVRSAVIRQIQHRKTRGERPLGDREQPAALDEATDLQAVWEREWVQHHFRTAMTRARDAFEPRSLAMFQRLVDGDPPLAIADAFEVGVDAVYKVRQRVRDHLRTLIEEQIRDERPADR